MGIKRGRKRRQWLVGGLIFVLAPFWIAPVMRVARLYLEASGTFYCWVNSDVLACIKG